MNNYYFVVGAGRSGTTSLSNILGSGTSGLCAIEPSPNLNVENRYFFDGTLTEFDKIISDTIIPRIATQRQNTIAGEKQVTLAGFIPCLAEITNCKFIYVHRDGRDVVRSWIDWHDQVFGSVYRECKNPGNLSPHAISVVANLPIELDYSDYSRPRPVPGDDLYNEWFHLSREEMCAFYWARTNSAHLKSLEQVSRARWMGVDYTSPTYLDIKEVIEFLGLQGIQKTYIEETLKNKINSIEQRGLELNRAPSWTNWNSASRDSFSRLAGSTMYSLGYWTKKCMEWRPSDYGKIWDQPKDLYAWYKWMFEGRQPIHASFFSWIRSLQTKEEIKSIADFGSGIGYGYTLELCDLKYTGFDISNYVVDWANQNNTNPQHNFICADHLVTPQTKAFDVVCSSGTIDNCYDIDEYVASMVNTAKKWIYFTCYKGWFPNLCEHSYSFNPEHGCFYNDVSPKRIHTTLTNLGCTNISISKLATKNGLIPYETEVFARVN